MNLYFQVLSQVQRAEIARLLVIPSELHSVSSGCKVKMAAGGKVRTCTYDVVERAIVDIESATFNELEIAYSTPNNKRFKLSGIPVSVTGVFKVAPTCDLWFKSADWPAIRERVLRNRKMNAKVAEQALSNFRVTLMPSVFEFVIEIETSVSKEDMLNECAEWIAKFFPKCLAPLSVFGAVDAGGPEFFVKFESNVLMTENIRILAKLFPSVFPELGKAFDALHPVLFGSKQLCNAIGEALGTDARVIASPRISDFAVLRLAADCDLQDANRRASRWMLLERSLAELEAALRNQNASRGGK